MCFSFNLYVQELLSKSFFQSSTSTQNSCFVMHDLINDLARSVAGAFSICLKDDKIHSVSEKTCHVSYLTNEFDVYERFEPIVESKCLRSFLPRGKYRSSYSHHHLSNRVLHNLLPEMKYLRVLCLSNYIIIDLLDSIDKLKHLCYLDLSGTRI